MRPALILLGALAAAVAGTSRAHATDAAAAGGTPGAGRLRGEAPAAGVELTLPFEGIWGVLQGFDSGDTHTGYAAFALDFAPPQPRMAPARAKHPRLSDFSCYGRPILAPADGTVVRVATGFRDLPPYPRAPPRHGGNFVIIQHAPGIYSELVHLQARSVRVAVGDRVRRGQAVARCGNSGNATTPHLHLGLLTSIDPITTGRMKLGRYEASATGDRWAPGDGEPRQGQWVRPAQSSGR